MSSNDPNPPINSYAYDVNALTGGSEVNLDHKKVVAGMYDLLCRSMRTVNGVEVKKECGIPNVTKNPLFLKEKNVPDVAIFKNNISCLQFEVESNNDKEATIYKLVYGLMDQLRCLINRNASTFKVIGFHIPVQPGYVVKVACIWSDSLLQYRIIREP